MISDNSKIKIAFEQLSRFEKDEAEKLAIADGAGDHIALIRKALADMKYRASRSSRTPRDVSDSLSVGGDVSPELVADEILYNCYLVTASDDETYYLYDHGVYLKVPRLEIEKKCRDLIQGKFTSHMLGLEAATGRIVWRRDAERSRIEACLCGQPGGVVYVQPEKVPDPSASAGRRSCRARRHHRAEAPEANRS